MVEETIEQVKEKQVIDLLDVAIIDLQRYGSASFVIRTVVGVRESIAKEYNEKYFSEPEETIIKKKKEEV